MAQLKSFCLFLLLIPVFSKGQTAQDTSFLQASILNAEKTYHAGIYKQLNIYNGRAYRTLPLTIEQHPYFLSDDWIMGSIVYENDQYQQVPIQYDLTSEKVITENPFNGAQMELVNSKIDWFEINGHTFVKLPKDNSSPVEHNGFYELLYDGYLKLYAKRKKDPQKRIEGNKLTNEYDEKNKYFLFTEKNYYPVTGKKSVMKVIGSNAKLPKPPKAKVESTSANKAEVKLITLIKFYDSHLAAL